MRGFPFLFGRAFIEANGTFRGTPFKIHFPSYSGGLSLRRVLLPPPVDSLQAYFPSYSGGLSLRRRAPINRRPLTIISLPILPFLFGRAFIEALLQWLAAAPTARISLPIREGFH